jgi:transcriptional regulator with XRE-family HTH domain
MAVLERTYGLGLTDAVSPPGGTPLPRLRELVRDLMAHRGLTYDDVAQRAGMSRATVHKIINEQNLHMPKPARLDAIASALGVPGRVIRQAAAESYGVYVYDESPDDATRALVTSIERLPEERRREIAALVQAMLLGGEPGGTARRRRRKDKAEDE